jgi:type IV pilus assembly protein PilC
MNYTYVAYTQDKRLVKGRLTAVSEEAANTVLNYGGYQIVKLKLITPFINTEKLAASFSRIKPKEIVMFARQLALLLESGTDIVTALELLQGQTNNRTLRKVLSEAAGDIRSGNPLSTALGKHPRAFSQMFARALAAGEQGGNLEIVLRQMADFMERQVETQKKVKNALTYPVIVIVVAMVVIAILSIFVFPSFGTLYEMFGVQMPLPTRILLGVAGWFSKYWFYLIGGMLLIAGVGYAYSKTPAGRYQRDRLLLKMPIIGRITHLRELGRCCRNISLLFKIGLPLPEIMLMLIQGSSNKIIAETLSVVREELIRGEGLFRPMSKRALFLPLMVQMVGVGEQTGNLDTTMATVAQSYEAEADELTDSAVGLIQPAITVFIGIIVAFIAVAMASAMYGVYGQANLG